MSQKLSERATDLLVEDSLKKLIQVSIKKTFSIKGRKKSLLLMLIVLVPFSLVISLSTSYKLEVINIIDFLNNIMLYFISLTFTGYAIFQALLGRNMQERLLTEGKELSKLKEYNLQFIGICTYILFILLLNVCLNILFKSNYLIKFISYLGQYKIFLENIFKLKIGIIYVYLLANLLVFHEMLTFFYNIYQAFSLHAVMNVIESLREKKEND